MRNGRVGRELSRANLHGSIGLTAATDTVTTTATTNSESISGSKVSPKIVAARLKSKNRCILIDAHKHIGNGFRGGIASLNRYASGIAQIKQRLLDSSGVGGIRYRHRLFAINLQMERSRER